MLRRGDVLVGRRFVGEIRPSKRDDGRERRRPFPREPFGPSSARRSARGTDALEWTPGVVGNQPVPVRGLEREPSGFQERGDDVAAHAAVAERHRGDASIVAGEDAAVMAPARAEARARGVGAEGLAAQFAGVPLAVRVVQQVVAAGELEAMVAAERGDGDAQGRGVKLVARAVHVHLERGRHLVAVER